MNRQKSSGLLQQLIFVGPSTIFFLIIIVVPFLLGLYYSFTDWNGVSGDVTWVGFDNFKQIITNDPDFGKAFWFTVRFTVIGIIVTNVLGFFLAYFLTKPLKSRNVLRTIFFMPNVIGGLLLGFIWQFIFVKGFSALGSATGWHFFNLPWLGDETTAFWGIVIVFVWQTAGYLMVIYISSINNIPKDILEAAEIDGASKLQILKSVIVPLVMPAVTVCLFLAISWSFKMFDLNLSLTKGGPFRSTESVALNIYNEAFQNNRYGLGTAKAIIFFVVVAIITSLQVKITKSKEVES
ncbi:carbohydrate ABC transporter permease [Paenibacillus cellulositrophicus]|uniref:ABC transporter permease n=4 Tax=Bacillales TaxID=1385 RepID=A0A1R1ELI7_9BACL|nr:MULTISPECIES: sugar ABC transporter permease [Paenibacillus]MCM3000457.1 sugar ABC transporter permease [Paenibacillus cellulositrophicus]MEC0179213.1 sugar ABC transporter permease [Paenibacillus favisporus]OMF52681.1 ABC transporter permease [Paenibacillus rhizosphaerae]OXL86142.1 ABC transporter permease [Paenibacillus sp. SSG-1]PQP86160.1 sugar ABC transporter permease [Paenibacillus sp. AR247]